MKRFVSDFVHRGLIAAGFGPIVLAVIYGILGRSGMVESLGPAEVCWGIISVTVVAFIAAGINAVYAVERLPLISAILIHALVLYLDYLIMYLCNSWIPRNWDAIIVFTAIFAAGYALIWAIIYMIIKRNTDKLNMKLNAK